MSDCNVCFEEGGIVRHFMPCGCKIPLCEGCVKKVARQERCLWCRRDADSSDDGLNEEDMIETAAVLAATQATIRTLQDKVQETQWQNTLLRVEMFHFKRYQFYRSAGFYTGFLGGLGVVLYGGLILNFGLTVLVHLI